LPMLHNPVSSPVLPKYFARQSTNLVGESLKPLEIVDRSKCLTLYPDPWDPTRFSLVKKASESNYWYAFLYDMFLDGKLSRWGDGSSNVLSYFVKSDILKLMRVGIDLVLLMTYKFVFACLPCLCKTYLEKDRLQVLVDAIGKIRISSQKRTAFCICYFRPDAKIHFAWSRKTRLTGKREQNWLLITKLCSTHSISFGFKVSAWAMPRMFG
jgi:hypothetical protein